MQYNINTFSKANYLVLSYCIIDKFDLRGLLLYCSKITILNNQIKKTNGQKQYSNDVCFRKAFFFTRCWNCKPSNRFLIHWFKMTEETQCWSFFPRKILSATFTRFVSFVYSIRKIKEAYNFLLSKLGATITQLSLTLFANKHLSVTVASMLIVKTSPSFLQTLSHK